MNLKPFIYFQLIICALVFTSCNKFLSNTDDSSKIVVEAYLIAESPFKVRIVSQIANEVISTSGNALSLPNLTVSIFENNTKKIPLVYTDNGYYIASDTSLKVKYGTIYSLNAINGSSVITATTTVPGKPINFTSSLTTVNLAAIAKGFFPSSNASQTDLVLTWQNTTNEYYMVTTTVTDVSPILVNQNFTNGPTNIARNTPSIVNTFTIRQQNMAYFGNYQSILYRLNPEYVVLYNSSDNSSQNLATPATNITNGFGIFTGISTATLNFKVIRSN
jgi:hypothetical protein